MALAYNPVHHGASKCHVDPIDMMFDLMLVR